MYHYSFLILFIFISTVFILFRYKSVVYLVISSETVLIDLFTLLFIDIPIDLCHGYQKIMYYLM